MIATAPRVEAPPCDSFKERPHSEFFSEIGLMWFSTLWFEIGTSPSQTKRVSSFPVGADRRCMSPPEIPTGDFADPVARNQVVAGTRPDR